ncbi:proclotting enzyme-like isoform X2 [Penaeus monodon]|uniref:proclotting enzyme-like isoform X2 n=1 Tax=Penaeus monodon TaxID=6687 RepID=UPI0018A7BD68|nr:proclotting enzyme-like isoform X2 [Penaeus monodon]
MKSFASAVLALTWVLLAYFSMAEGRIFLNNLFGKQKSEGPERCPCSCGLPNRKMRLVGGNWAEINEYPWMVALLYKGHFYCGGTLISDRYVLTAAHCIEGVNVNNLRVMIGDHVRSFPIETKSRDYQAVYSVYHHEFNRSTYNHDIGLVKLGQKVEYKWYSRPACLPQPNSDYVGELGIVTGWGRTAQDGDPTDTLKEILVPIFSNPACRALRYKPHEITDNMMCAGYIAGGTDSCHGDSGGGLMWQGRDGKMDVIAIVSWGQGCARRGYPGVYTRVNNYLDWIEEHTKDSCYCGRRQGRS